MRIFASVSVVILASALALPAAACDRHGGMYGQLSGASWTDYNPATAESDSLFLQKQLAKWHAKNAAKAAEVKPVKPSFSKASDRASLAAKARLATKKVDLSEQAAFAPVIKVAKTDELTEATPR